MGLVLDLLVQLLHVLRVRSLLEQLRLLLAEHLHVIAHGVQRACALPCMHLLTVLHSSPSSHLHALLQQLDLLLALLRLADHLVEGALGRGQRRLHGDRLRARVGLRMLGSSRESG